jgi:DNA-binding transcriptional LysR family regulator
VYDWNDVRVFLAVARGGSTLAASRILNVNQTTVARRVAALEQALGFALFDRLQSGYRPTEVGELIRGAAERLESEAEVLARLAAQHGRKLSGVIRVTTNESMANALLTPCLAEFAELYPDIQIQVLVDDRRVDIAGGEADVAIRAGSRPTDPDLVIRKLCVAAWAFYCSTRYAERRGFPRSLEDLNGHLLLGGDGVLARAPAVLWMEANTPDSTIVNRSNSLTNLIVALRAGLGVGPLPCMEGDAAADLVRCFAPPPEFESEVLLIIRSELRDVPRVRAFIDFVTARTAQLRPLLEGRVPAPGSASTGTLPNGAERPTAVEASA